MSYLRRLLIASPHLILIIWLSACQQGAFMSAETPQEATADIESTAAAEKDGTVPAPTAHEWLEETKYKVQVIHWKDECPWDDSTEFFDKLAADSIASPLIQKASAEQYVCGQSPCYDDPMNAMPMFKAGYYLVFRIKAEFNDKGYDPSLATFNSLAELKAAVHNIHGEFVGEQCTLSLREMELSPANRMGGRVTDIESADESDSEDSPLIEFSPRKRLRKPLSK